MDRAGVARTPGGFARGWTGRWDLDALFGPLGGGILLGATLASWRFMPSSVRPWPAPISRHAWATQRQEAKDARRVVRNWMGRWGSGCIVGPLRGRILLDATLASWRFMPSSVRPWPAPISRHAWAIQRQEAKDARRVVRNWMGGCGPNALWGRCAAEIFSALPWLLGVVCRVQCAPGPRRCLDLLGLFNAKKPRTPGGSCDPGRVVVDPDAFFGPLRGRNLLGVTLASLRCMPSSVRPWPAAVSRSAWAFSTPRSQGRQEGRAKLDGSLRSECISRAAARQKSSWRYLGFLAFHADFNAPLACADVSPCMDFSTPRSQGRQEGRAKLDGSLRFGRIVRAAARQNSSWRYLGFLAFYAEFSAPLNLNVRLLKLRSCY